MKQRKTYTGLKFYLLFKMFQKNQIVNWYLGESIVVDVKDGFCQLMTRSFGLPCRVAEDVLARYQINTPKTVIRPSVPHMVVVDNFYTDPDSIVEIANQQLYAPNEKAFKGQRSGTRFLLPGLMERFESLLQVKIKNWLYYPTNGIFQITSFNDPLVYHSDLQNYAAAIYLTNGPVDAGTSFWRDKNYGCRRPPQHELENSRFEGKDLNEIHDSVYNEYNFLHSDNWERVDRVGSVYNRLVIWDAQLIHSASSYKEFVKDSRLVQLFFFDIEK